MNNTIEQDNGESLITKTDQELFDEETEALKAGLPVSTAGSEEEEKELIGNVDGDDNTDKNTDSKTDNTDNNTGTDSNTIADETVAQFVLDDKKHSTQQKQSEIVKEDPLINIIKNNRGLQNAIAKYLENGGQEVPQQQQQEEVADKEFEVSDLNDFSSEKEWLADNMQRLLERERQNARAQQRQIQQQQQAYEIPISERLQARDAENYELVMSKMGSYVDKLSVKDYNRINNDIGALYQFYDFIKDREVKAQNARMERQNNKGNNKKPAFRIKSNNVASNNNNKPQGVDPWRMSEAEFNKIKNKARGFTE